MQEIHSSNQSSDYERAHWSPIERQTEIEKPTVENLEKVFSQATAEAAIAAHKVIESTYSRHHELNSSEIKALKVAIDGAAVNGMSRVLHNQHDFLVHSVGSEGAKEVLHDGEEAPRMNGKYGKDHAQYVDKVSDAVEGTSAAARNEPGAVSVVAVSEFQGLMPSEDGQFYLEKLFGPPQLNGYLSLEYTPEENIVLALDILGIPPEMLTVVILNRERNNTHIEAARRLGVNLQLIEGGDLMPALLSVADPSTHSAGAHLVMGIGGFEEGIISAAGAKTQAGLAQTRRWSNDTKNFVGEILTTQDMVPGDAGSTIVSVSGITSDPWFDISPVTKEGNYYFANTMTISTEGYKFGWVREQ